MKLSINQLAGAVGCNQDVAFKWLPHIMATMVKYGIDTVNEQASFIAQVSHESAQFSRISENLYYSAEGLARTWPKRYAQQNGLPNDLAKLLAKRPDAIANNCYANRMGNGDVASGDGWRYRGRGLIQLTGRSMYKLLSMELGIDFVAAPDLLTTEKYASLSAGWFWSYKGLDKFDDDTDVLAETKIINGGTTGQKERDAAMKRALAALAKP